MLLLIVAKLAGGFWQLRERTLTARGWKRRAWFFAYTHYLESLGSYIAIEADIAGEIKFPHKPMGVFIAPGAVIGIGCVMFQGVGLLSTDGGSPRIGDGVLFGAGAQVVGPVTVGDGARLGAGVTVACDVPAGATVVPAKPRFT